MKDSDFKKRLFSECVENLALKGRSAAGTGGTQPTDTQHTHDAIAFRELIFSAVLRGKRDGEAASDTTDVIMAAVAQQHHV